MKKIIRDQEAIDKIKEGASLMSGAVSVTLGPSGANVMIRNSGDRHPFSTKDGVTVANEIFSEDPFVMSVIESFQEIAKNTDQTSGDGTSTATVIANAIIQGGFKAMLEENNILDVKKGIDQTVSLIVNMIKELSQSVEGDLDWLKKIAMVSSNYDETISEIVTKAFKTAGKQGVVRIKRSSENRSYVTSIKGMALPMGFNSVYYVNNFDNNTCVFESCRVFITEKKITKMTPNFEALLNECAEKDEPLLIVCKDIDPIITDMFLRNKRDAGFKICVCKAPGFGNEHKDHLLDLATALGGTAFLENDSFNFEDLKVEQIFDHVAISEEVTVGEHTTSLKGPLFFDKTREVPPSEENDNEGFTEVIKTAEDQEEQVKLDVEGRVAFLRSELEKKITVYEKGIIQSRISRLSDGIAYIYISSFSETEYKEKQARVQDALYAVKGANAEGILPGGGTALLSISKTVFESKSKNESMQIGSNIVLDAIRAPFFQILENVGAPITFSDLNKCEQSFDLGFNAKTEKIENLKDSGIVDPAKVTRVALENAASIAGMLLTTKYMIVDDSVYTEHNMTQARAAYD